MSTDDLPAPRSRLIDVVRRQYPTGIVRRLSDGRRRSHFQNAVLARQFSRLPLIVGRDDPFPFTALFTAVDLLLTDNADHLIPHLAPLAEGKTAFERGIYKALCDHGEGRTDAAFARLERYGNGERFDGFRRMCARAWALFLQLPRLQDAPAGDTTGPMIFQFWDTKNVPKDVSHGMRTWRGQSRHPYRLFDAEGARSFLLSTYGPEAAKIFDSCPHAAVQADYFRLGWLSEHGGIYVDADERMLRTFPKVSARFSERLVLQFVSSHPGGHFNNAFIAAPPGSASLRAAFSEATKRLSVGTDAHVFTLAGPGLLTDTLLWQARDGVLEDAVTFGPGFWKRYMMKGINAEYKNDARSWHIWLAARQAGEIAT